MLVGRIELRYLESTTISVGSINISDTRERNTNSLELDIHRKRESFTSVLGLCELIKSPHDHVALVGGQFVEESIA